MSSPTPTSPVPPKMNEFATSDPDVAHDWLQAVYAEYQPEEFNSQRPFRFRGTHTPLGRSSVSRLEYSMSADNNLALSDVLLVLRPTDDNEQYLIYTRWSDEQTYRAWESGQDFARAHEGGGDDLAPAASDSHHLWSYEVLESAGPAGGRA